MTPTTPALDRESTKFFTYFKFLLSSDLFTYNRFRPNNTAQSFRGPAVFTTNCSSLLDHTTGTFCRSSCIEGLTTWASPRSSTLWQIIAELTFFAVKSTVSSWNSLGVEIRDIAAWSRYCAAGVIDFGFFFRRSSGHFCCRGGSLIVFVWCRGCVGLFDTAIGVRSLKSLMYCTSLISGILISANALHQLFYFSVPPSLTFNRALMLALLVLCLFACSLVMGSHKIIFQRKKKRSERERKLHRTARCLPITHFKQVIR